MSKQKKGGKFERDLCRQLSVWWSDGQANDWFWRSAGSGAMATVRSRRGGRQNDAGDLRAMDPQGQGLVDLFCIEAKRGYPKAYMMDLMLTDRSAMHQLINNAMAGWESGNAHQWMLVHKKDFVAPLVYMASDFVTEYLPMILPMATIIGKARVACIELHRFMTLCDRDDLESILVDLKRKQQ